MANFLASLRSSASALDALQRSVTTSQNNVSNAATPGYARQRMTLKAGPFDPSAGLNGGVTATGLASARDTFAEATVRHSQSAVGLAEQRAKQLAWAENAVDLNDAAGVASALDRMYRAFTSWSLAPGSMSEKENVHAAASDFAEAFNRTADAVLRSATEAEEQIRTTLATVDTIVQRIRAYNEDRRQERISDAGVEAVVHADLEELSELIDVQALWQDDGTVTVLAGNQAPLVIGDRAYRIEAEFTHTDPTPLYPGALPPVTLRDASGNDVTRVIGGGKLKAIVEFRNETVPHYIGDTQTSGELNRLAKQIADRVNTILAAGWPPPQPPVDLFVYGNSPVAVAHAIKVNPALAPALLNATDMTQVPPVVNGNAQKLAALARPSDAADMLDGLSFIAYFGKISADAGRTLANAQTEAQSRRLMTVQAQNLRDQVSAVSLDEEAIRLVEYQRAYQASARVVTILDELTEIAVNIGRR